jgi:hypothetical protein
MKRLGGGDGDSRRGSEFMAEGTENEFSRFNNQSRTQGSSVSPGRENDTFYKVLGPDEARKDSH